MFYTKHTHYLQGADGQTVGVLSCRDPVARGEHHFGHQCRGGKRVSSRTHPGAGHRAAELGVLDTDDGGGWTRDQHRLPLARVLLQRLQGPRQRAWN